MKKVVIAGGTGFLGSYLAKRFPKSDYEVLIVSRSQEHVSWKHEELTRALEGAELVINLAGKNINCRHTEANRKLILESRVNTTLQIGNAAMACKKPPKLWINASATGVYRHSVNTAMTEESGEEGTDFLSDVVREWEKTFFEFNLPETRQVVLRTSVVLNSSGGALKPLVILTRLGLGGKQAGGRQKISWIHIEDYFRILTFLLRITDVNGVVNCTSPSPVSNREFMYKLRKELNMPFGIPAPEFAVKLGAALIQTEPELLIGSSFVLPKRLLDAGFNFSFPTLDLALSNLLK